MTGPQTIHEPTQRSNQQGVTTHEEDEETCPNGEARCEGGDGDRQPCFAYFNDIR